MAACKQCGKAIESIPGKVARQYCGSACRQAYRRSQPVTDQPVTDQPVTEPLAVYSQRHWDYLQSRGYTWDVGRQRATRIVRDQVQIGVVVPGDPAYGPNGDNTCIECGKPTGHRLVVKCGPCCWGRNVTVTASVTVSAEPVAAGAITPNTDGTPI